MRLLRLGLLIAAAAFAWRVLHGRGHQVLQRAAGAARPLTGRGSAASGDASSSHGTHPSAASAANDSYRDDRDVTVGENLSAIGMRPGAM